MRLPPLPPLASASSPEEMASRAVGNRPTEVTRPITISEYSPDWPVRFEREKERIREALGDCVLALDHVGSTAVPGLPAKDRVDIDLIVTDPADEDRALYAAAKYRAAAAHPMSMAGYVAAKATVIIAVLRRAGLT